MQKARAGRKPVWRDRARPGVAESVTGSEWQGGPEGRPDHGGLPGHRERLGPDSRRGREAASRWKAAV